eukprot:2713499-Ditylum_brightwellii.AAC.1
MADAYKNYTEDNKQTVEKLLAKISTTSGTTEILQMMPSHDFYLKHSVEFTKVFGKFACIICSSILGIGSAEHNWKAVKDIKQGQRSHVESVDTKMFSTLKISWGAEKIDAARSNPDIGSVIDN